ncbi:hypothetical protein ANN_17290 [Periplaneta americana]|uniref:Mariner Mos1 transposase n=1 Tax=Periplaneta americana TaxID=6978 RepID=A0ABQ8SSJ2_PERAM|nr:hypothetical protein ANN_17290 [Periplaneta americana]
MKIYVHLDDLDKAADAIITLPALILSSWIQINIRFRKNSLLQLLRFADCFTWEDLPPKDPVTGNTSMGVWIRRIKSAAVRVITFGLSAFFLHSFTRNILSEERFLTLDAWYPYDWSKSPVFEITNVIQGIAAIGFAAFMYTFPPLYATLVLIACSQLEKLRNTLLNIKQKCILFNQKSSDGSKEQFQIPEEMFFQMKEQLNKCVRLHQDIISIKDDVRSGRPTTATNEATAQRVRNVARDDRRKTIKEIAAEVGISVGSVHNVLHKHLNMHYVSQKLVPKMLWAEQKETRMTLTGDMICMADEDGDFLNKIIAGDETWCYLYDPVPKRQSSVWKSKKSPRKQTFPSDTSKGKVMLEVFFDSQGLIHHEFIPEGRTVTKELYVEILRRLRDAVRMKRPEKWVENNWFLMHDNAPAHRAIIVKNFLARHNITALDHPPYSPDLSPPDYFLFPRLKSHLKGRRFNAEEVIANATRALRRVSQNGCQELYTRWQKCVVAEGKYFEGNAVE